jgi:adenylylsulfate kinase-like enzyme
MKIIIEGKQGEGKSRLASHVAAALMTMGFTVHLYDRESEGNGDPVRSGPAINKKFARIFVRQTP